MGVIVLNTTSLWDNDVITPTSTEIISNFKHNASIIDNKCLDWKDAQHVLYQLANLGFAVAFLVPGTISCHGPLLRGLVCCGCLFVVLWGGTVTCHLDVMCWNATFLLVNMAHLVYAAYAAYPVQFNSDLEIAYHKLFLPVHVSRSVFKQLSDLGQLWNLQKGAIYAEEGATYAWEHLSLLLSGHLQVTHQGVQLHVIEPGCFVDSIEYESAQNKTECTFQVSYTALEDCKLLTIRTDILSAHMDKFPEIKSLFTVLLGRDVHQKLTLVQEGLMRDPKYQKFVKHKKRKLFCYNDRSDSLSKAANVNFQKTIYSSHMCIPSQALDILHSNHSVGHSCQHIPDCEVPLLSTAHIPVTIESAETTV